MFFRSKCMRKSKGSTFYRLLTKRKKEKKKEEKDED